MASSQFVREVTRPAVVPFVPEIMLRTAGDPYELWERTGQEPPPFWAFPWAGGQGLARYVLDHPSLVAHKTVLDAASGSGLVAIAAAKAGARRVVATDIDPCALAAIELNAADNDAAVETAVRDLRDDARIDADVVLAADVFYDRSVASQAVRFLRRAHDTGAEVLVADPGRAFLPTGAFSEVVAYAVPVLRSLEEADVKTVTVYRLRTVRGRSHPRSA